MRICRLALVLAAMALGASFAAPAGEAAGSRSGGSDPLCTRDYGAVRPGPARRVRFGIDPGLPGSAGSVQVATVPDDLTRDVAAVKALEVPGRILVVRLNRLFWSDGASGIARFRAEAARYARIGAKVEIQVRYHPQPRQEGNIAAWASYVRQVVDAFGLNRSVISLTITNEVNLPVSPNTSDGPYRRAQDAVIAGIESAAAEARRRRFRQLTFGFTYAYRLSPQRDVDFFGYLRAHGGVAFRRALGFVGLDSYPGAVYPSVLPAGDTYSHELARAAGTLRQCLMPRGGIPTSVPIWITENGAYSGKGRESQQVSALRELTGAASAYARRFNITDYRWFNLRDSVLGGPVASQPLAFSTFGLLRADYKAKPALAAYRAAIGRSGVLAPRPARKRK